MISQKAELSEGGEEEGTYTRTHMRDRQRDRQTVERQEREHTERTNSYENISTILSSVKIQKKYQDEGLGNK